MERACSVIELLKHRFTLLVQIVRRLPDNGPLIFVVRSNLEDVARRFVRPKQLLERINNPLDGRQQILLLQSVIECAGRNIRPDDVGIHRVQCDLLLR